MAQKLFIITEEISTAVPRYSINMGFDHYTSKEFMNILQTTPKGWATDDILVPNIMESMDTTEGQDFVFTISVEGHGEYPTEKVLDRSGDRCQRRGR